MTDVFSNLRSIGIFFTSEDFDFTKEIITPENALIGSLSTLKSDKLTLSLVLEILIIVLLSILIERKLNNSIPSPATISQSNPHVSAQTIICREITPKAK